MQTSTSSLSRYCRRGSRDSFTWANVLTGVVDIALFRSAIAIDRGFPAIQCRRGGANSDCDLVAVLETPAELVKLRLAKGRVKAL